MQNKGAIKALAIVFGLIFLYQLSFTVITKVTEGRAAKYAQGDAVKEKMYLDSISKKQQENLTDNSFSWLLKNFTYSKAKEREINLGLDLKGGMNLTLEVSVKEIVEALANVTPADTTFQQAIQLASERQKKNGGDFVTLFGQAYEEIDPNGSLAALYSYEFKDKGIDNKSSNSDVLKVLKKECDDAFNRSYQILSTRIDRFGVAQPNIQKMEGSGRILVELPGIKDPERVRKLLQGTAQLEFWETYNFDEVYQYFNQANEFIANKNKDNQALAKDTETEEVSQEETEAQTETEVQTETTETELVEAETTEQNDLLDQIGEDESGLENLNVEEDLTVNPLYALLRPSFYENGPAKTARVGIALESDTAKINEMLRLAKENNIFPRDMKLAWTVKPEKFDKTEYLELIALKMTNNSCALGGECITDARQDFGMHNEVEVDIQMNKEGAKEWKRLTGSNIGRQIAIVLDDYVYSYPVVNQEIGGGRSQISGGGMTIEEGQDLANILKAGKLPARVHSLGDEVVGPSLGKESVRKGMWSMIFAFILVLVYMVFFYKKAGLVADVALIVNVFFLFGVLACLGSVLTLPGIAGIVLTLGMAVDSNVIIFERIKEELRGGKGLRPAIDAGYKNAYSAIIDGNVTTLITGIVLIVLGTGPVHSFAVTLCIGILTSLFTSIFISRLIFTRMLDKEKEISYTTKFTENFLKDTHFDFIKFRKTAYIIALVMIVISAGSLAFKGLNLGIDFKGGRNYIVRFDQDVKVNDVRDALDVTKINVEGWEKPEVKTYGPNGQVKITTKYKIEDDEPEVDTEIQEILYNGLKGLFNNKEITIDQFSSEDETIGVLQTQKVGGTIANDVTRKSIWAIAISLLLMFGYIAIRFRKWQYGLSALAALTHDTVIMLGMYSLFFNILPFTMEVDQAFIAAVLTIIGYSINATVVIFDRVRENTTLHPKSTWRENINNAVNSTLTRSFNTSGSTFVVLLAIFFFGGDTIRGFIFALLVGILAGTFSSVFLSSPIAYNLIGGQKQEKELAEAEEKNAKKK